MKYLLIFNILPKTEYPKSLNGLIFTVYKKFSLKKNKPENPSDLQSDKRGISKTLNQKPYLSTLKHRGVFEMLETVELWEES